MMAGKLLQRLPCHLERDILRTSLLGAAAGSRHGHTMRGKPPGVAKTLEQRMSEENIVDPDIARLVDIGFPKLRPSRSQQLKERLAHVKQQRSDPELERQARAQTLEINLDEVKRDWLATSGQFHIRDLAKHFGVYQDLFGSAFFVPRVPLDVQFSIGEETLAPVFYGNTIKPSDAKNPPNVTFDSTTNLAGQTSSESLWTLILTNPDGHLKDSSKEYVHWMITNIPGGQDVLKGDQIVPYIQPFPAKGTGYHRHIFILYKQSKRLDLSSHSLKDKIDLDGRTFNTLDFYRQHQDDITPAGLAFFQSTWEQSLSDFYHHTLDLKEPVYEYDFPKQYIKDQTWFPLREPFNLYMDKYRDQKQVTKEFLVRKLAKTHPFEGPEAPLQFPNAHPITGVPSWLKTEKKKARLGWGRINDV